MNAKNLASIPRENTGILKGVHDKLNYSGNSDVNKSCSGASSQTQCACCNTIGLKKTNEFVR